MSAKGNTTVHSTVKGGSWLVVSAVIINLLQFASVIIVARFLSPDDYGLVATATTILVILSSMTEMFLGEALIRKKDPQKHDVDTIWTLGFIRGIVGALIFVVLAYPIAAFYRDDRLFAIMMVLALSPLSLGLQNPYRFIQQKEMIFHQEFIITVVQKLVSVVLTIVIAAIYKSYWSLIIGNVLFFASGTIVSFMLNPYKPGFSLRGAREVLHFSVWVMLSQAVNLLNGRFELLIIGRILGMATLGLYSMGSNLAVMATEEIMKPLRRVIYPAFTKVLNGPTGQEDPERLRSAYQRTQSFVTALVLPVSIGFAVTAEPLVRLVFSERWHAVIFILQYLSAVFGFQTLGSLVRPLGMAKGQTDRLFVRDTQMLFIRMPIIIGAMLVWGLMGIIIARIVTGIISIVVNLRLIRDFLHLSIAAQLWQNLRAIVGVAVMAAAILSVGSMFNMDGGKLELAGILTAEIVTGVVIYALALFGLWLLMGKPEGPETEMIRLARAFAARKRR